MVKPNFLAELPWLDKIRKTTGIGSIPAYREANGHIHTPYSFSAFDKIDTVFSMAREEKIDILGINDFYVTDGYDAFAEGCTRNNIFPLFNIEFIGLLKKEQKQGIRINDPNNPGRIYFSGKGLDYPFNPGFFTRKRMKKMIDESQKQIMAMVDKLNELTAKVNPSIRLTYEEIKSRYAHDLVRERHLAKALRIVAAENYPEEKDQLEFIQALCGDRKIKAGTTQPAMLENEIRSYLLKAGGDAFVPENAGSFLPLSKIIKIITGAGGIPCYPVLLDDPSGNYTEFEADPGRLHKRLSSLDVGCIELIPGRNDIGKLKDFVEYFYRKGYVITFGTEHNTPDLIPLTVTARGKQPLDESLKKIAWEGACVIAAHQYLRAHHRQGYVLEDGNPSRSQRDDLAQTGKMIVEFYLNRK
ncbi:MAG: hypothetical protein JXR66_09750 [Bacteroidales bacterium]|nr:hypothetical protein [Bacteroidales bacterium]